MLFVVFMNNIYEFIYEKCMFFIDLASFSLQKHTRPTKIIKFSETVRNS